MSVRSSWQEIRVAANYLDRLGLLFRLIMEYCVMWLFSSDGGS